MASSPGSGELLETDTPHQGTTEYACELKFVMEFYGQDFNEDQLKLQLETLSANLPSSVHDLPLIITHFKSFSTAQRSLLSQVCTLLSLILVIPATNAVSERSFSALRRISTFLRTTMTQNRLNSKWFYMYTRSIPTRLIYFM